MVSSRPATGPVVLVTSSPYDTAPSQSTSQSVVDFMDESEDDGYPQGRSIPGLDAIAQDSQSDPFSARVLPRSPSATPTSNPTTRLRSASTAFGGDSDACIDTESPDRSTASGSPKKARSSSSKSKRDDLSEIVRACTSESLASRIRLEEERTKREEMRLNFQREEAIRQERMRADERRFLIQMLQITSQAANNRQQTDINFESMLANMPGGPGLEEANDPNA
jgi:hypothetical protein